MKLAFQRNSKFTIHPFRSLHSRHLLPLSPTDYVARFGLELVVIAIAIFTIATNIGFRAKSGDSKDSSVVFSFLSENPQLNRSLIAANETSTITASSDQWIQRAQAADGGVVLASSATNSSASSQTTIQDNVIVKTNPADTSNLRHGITNYQVKSGDNLISIASSFGISPATIIMENNLDQSGLIKPGQDLTILPVEGISYTLKSGDTLDAIAAKYKISLDDLLEVNDLELATDVQAGDNIIIPTKVTLPTTTTKKYVTNNNGQIPATKTAAANISAGSLSFIWPTVTHNITQGFSSRHSGLDISDSRKESIFAAESGQVIYAGWNSQGYGNMILINHGNGFETRYGHASEIDVKAGDYVSKGQVIGKQGNTGHVVGVTGIHLHFEILVNGHAVNPLVYVKP